MKRLVRAAFLQWQEDPSDEAWAHYQSLLLSHDSKDWAIDRVLRSIGILEPRPVLYDGTTASVADNASWTPINAVQDQQADIHLTGFSYAFTSASEFNITSGDYIHFLISYLVTPLSPSTPLYSASVKQSSFQGGAGFELYGSLLLNCFLPANNTLLVQIANYSAQTLTGAFTLYGDKI